MKSNPNMSYPEIVIREIFGLLFDGKIKRTGNKYKKVKPSSN